MTINEDVSLQNEVHPTTTEQVLVEIVDLMGEPIGGGLTTNPTSERKGHIMVSMGGINSVLHVSEWKGEVAGLLSVETEEGKKVGFGLVKTWPEAALWISGKQCWIARQ